MDALAQAMRKGAANCNNHCDLQISENQLKLECGVCFWILPESLSTSVLLLQCMNICLCFKCINAFLIGAVFNHWLYAPLQCCFTAFAEVCMSVNVLHVLLCRLHT